MAFCWLHRAAAGTSSQHTAARRSTASPRASTHAATTQFSTPRRRRRAASCHRRPLAWACSTACVVWVVPRRWGSASQPRPPSGMPRTGAHMRQRVKPGLAAAGPLRLWQGQERGGGQWAAAGQGRLAAASPGRCSALRAAGMPPMQAGAAGARGQAQAVAGQASGACLGCGRLHRQLGHKRLRQALTGTAGPEGGGRLRMAGICGRVVEPRLARAPPLPPPLAGGRTGEARQGQPVGAVGCVQSLKRGAACPRRLPPRRCRSPRCLGSWRGTWRRPSASSTPLRRGHRNMPHTRLRSPLHSPPGSMWQGSRSRRRSGHGLGCCLDGCAPALPPPRRPPWSPTRPRKPRLWRPW